MARQPRQYKCYGYCGKKYPIEQLKKFKANPESKSEGSNHCKECFKQKEKDVNERKDLYNFLKELFNITFPTGLMLRQIKNFKEEHGYSYKNIKFAVDYIYNVKKVYSPTITFGIAGVPYFYDEMINYYKELNEKRASTVVKETKSRKIMIDPPTTNFDYKDKKLINMEALLNDE